MIPTDGRASCFQFSKLTEICLDPQLQARLLQSLPDHTVFCLAQILAIPRCVCARLKIQERCQLADSPLRQWPRMTKLMKCVERDNAQDSQRRPGRRAQEERQTAEQAGSRHEAGSHSSGARAVTLRSVRLRHDTAPLLEDTSSESARDR